MDTTPAMAYTNFDAATSVKIKMESINDPYRPVKPPPVFVIDHDYIEGHEITVLYRRANNEVDFRVAYKQVREMKVHAGRGEIRMNWNGSAQGSQGQAGSHLRLIQCSNEFIEHFFTVCAMFVDYFADFYPHDRSNMQYLWTGLWDTMQEAAQLPHTQDTNQPSCTHSEGFQDSWNGVNAFINKILTGARPQAENQVHQSDAEGDSGTNYGAFKTGLTPWQQFLTEGSPGFGVAETNREYAHDLPEAGEIDKTKEIHVPMGALALIGRHREKLRQATEKVAEQDGKNVKDALDAFDARAMPLGESFTYTSLDGRTRLVRQMHPAGISKETPRRNPEFANLNTDEQFAHHTLADLDELAGDAVGVEEFVHPCGNDKFQMWSVGQVEGKSEPVPDIVDGQPWGQMYEGPWTTEDLQLPKAPPAGPHGANDPVFRGL